MSDDRFTSTLDSTSDVDASGTTGTETHPLAETGKEAGQRAGKLVERGAQIGLTQADRGLDQAATGVASVAESIRRVSADMEAKQPQIADVALTAADQAEALAGYLRDNDVRQIIGNVESFARRQPLLFLGGAFMLGMAASRFIKAAGGRGQSQQVSGYRSGYSPRTDNGAEWSAAATGPGVPGEF